jgi:hypothetical protein
MTEKDYFYFFGDIGILGIHNCHNIECFLSVESFYFIGKLMSNQKISEYPSWKYLASIVLFALIVSHPLFAYSVTESNKIESQMHDEAGIILNQSTNNSEKAEMIIQWEQEQFNFPAANHFNEIKHLYYLRDIARFPSYFLYINRANCGELAIVFEDMVNRTNIPYRKIIIDGMLNPKSMTMNNHRFSELMLENDSWMIADVGFNMYPPRSSKYEFTENRGYLVGHVAIANDDGTFTDCTSSYVKNTSKIIVNAKKDGVPASNADIEVELLYNDTKVPVIGNIIRYETNESGTLELNLGSYDECSYTVIVKDGFYQNSTTFVPDEDMMSIDIEVDKLNLDSTVIIALLLVSIMVYPSWRFGNFIGEMLLRKKRK